MEKVEHALIVVIFAQIFGLLEVTSANIEAAGNPYNVEAKHLQDDEKMEKLGDVWQCKDCLWETKYKTRLWEHVEAKHVQSSGYCCPYCSKFCSSKNAWKQHKSKFHSGS